MSHKCEECGHDQFFWHGYHVGKGLATCLRCKVLNYFRDYFGEPKE